jgi:hypothetical protein
VLERRPIEQRLTRLNAICPYYTMFPLEFPLEALASAHASEWVLDPFCGRGTTLFAARLLGMSAVGIDSNPVAVAATAAKLVATSPTSIVARAEALLREGRTEPVPQGRFWRLCFDPRVLQELCVLRTSLAKATSPVDLALRAILLGALHGPRNKCEPSYLSNQMPRTYSTKPEAAVRYWTTRGLRPERVDVLQIVARHARWRYDAVPARVPSQVLEGRAEDLLPRIRRRFDWVVTSPPYPGMVTYRSDQWLRNWFLGGPTTVDYSRDGQLGAARGKSFLDGLTQVWHQVAKCCTPNARMVIRFGGLPSVSGDNPRTLLEKSLAASDKWRLLDLSSAGEPGPGRRQADQFGEAGKHVYEVDCLAARRG